MLPPTSHTSVTCPDSATNWEPTVNGLRLRRNILSKPPKVGSLNNGETESQASGSQASTSDPRPVAFAWVDVDCDKGRPQNLRVQPRDGIAQKPPKFHTSHEQAGRPHSGKTILFFAGLLTHFQHQGTVFRKKKNLLWKLVRDERCLWPEKAEATNTAY